MYTFLTLGIGALITLMNGINADLASLVGQLPAMAVIHLAGLAAVSLILLFRGGARRGGTVPPYLYGGGAIGVATVFACAYSYPRIGASLAVALALAGQTAGAIVVDSTGLLGLKRYPFAPSRLLGLGFAVTGIFLMVGEWRADAASLVLAFMSGLSVLTSSILNSALAARIGHWRGVRANYLVGLGATGLLFLALRPALAPAAGQLAQAGPVLLLGGGTLGVAVVGGICFVLPRMPVLGSTLAIFSGEVAAGLLLDALGRGPIPTRKLVGALVLLVGLAGSSIAARRGAKGEGKPEA